VLGPPEERLQYTVHEDIQDAEQVAQRGSAVFILEGFQLHEALV